MSSAQSMQTGTVSSADAAGAVVATPAVAPTWKSLYTVGGAAALISAVFLPIQIIVFLWLWYILVARRLFQLGQTDQGGAK